MLKQSLLFAAGLSAALAAAAEGPNILWITAEDLSPSLGGYGDTFARTFSLGALLHLAKE